MSVDSPDSRVGDVPRIVLGLILVFYILKELLFVVAIPPWQGPDEFGHFAAIQEIALTGELPTVYGSILSREVQDSIVALGFPQVTRGGPFPIPQTLPKPAGVDFERAERYNWQSQQNPLYYVFNAMIYRLVDSRPLVERIFLFRLISLTFGLLAVIGAWMATRLLFPGDPFLQVGVPVALAFLPTFSFLAAVITNDPAMVFFGVLFFLMLIKFWQQPVPHYSTAAALGLAFGLGVLTRLNFATLVFVEIPVLGLCLLKKQSSRRKVILAVILVLVVQAAVGGGWFIRNKLELGYYSGVWASDTDDAGIAEGYENERFIDFLLSRGVLAGYPRLAFCTFWASYGWGTFTVGPRGFAGYFALTLLAGAGLALLILRSRRPDSPISGRGLLMLFLALGTGAACFAIAYKVFVSSQIAGRMGAAWGRYYYPMIYPLLVGLILGLRQITPARLRPLGLIAMVLFFVGGDLYGLFHKILPNYAWGWYWIWR